MEKSGLFPKLNEEQIEMISQYSEIREAKKGENLIKVGERNHNFFVVLKGAVANLGSNNEALAIHKTGNLPETVIVFLNVPQYSVLWLTQML
jgi:signal-transduction protein with cAMP-binding, CBS, and nucleotidyltransferase domain